MQLTFGGSTLGSSTSAARTTTATRAGLPLPLALRQADTSHCSLPSACTKHPSSNSPAGQTRSVNNQALHQLYSYLQNTARCETGAEIKLPAACIVRWVVERGDTTAKTRCVPA